MMTELATIMIKTVATTIDFLILAVLIFADKTGNRKMKTAYAIFMLANLSGIWI